MDLGSTKNLLVTLMEIQELGLKNPNDSGHQFTRILEAVAQEETLPTGVVTKVMKIMVEIAYVHVYLQGRRKVDETVTDEKEDH